MCLRCPCSLFGSMYPAIVCPYKEVAWKSAEGMCLYCCITNVHKCGSLKQTSLLWEVSVAQESGHDLVVSSAPCLTWLWSRSDGTGLSRGWNREWFASKLSQVIGRIYLLVVLKSLFTGWLSLRDCSWLLAASCSFLSWSSHKPAM